jgi:hypothetical protein
MAEILGLGVTHSPLLVSNEERMAGIFERALNSPRLPPAARDPANWPPQMRQEWAEHQAGPHPHIAIVRLKDFERSAQLWTRSTRTSF